MSNVTAAFIAKHHPKVKELMLQRQEEQSFKSDWKVFTGYVTAPRVAGGYDWMFTPEGAGAWHQALFHGNFDPLYALHPEWGEPKPTKPKPLVDGEWYWMKINEGDAWEAGLYFDGHIGESEPFFETRTCIYYVEEIHAIHPEPIKKPE